MKEAINSYVSSLVPNNNYDSQEIHHIVAENDARATIAKMTLYRSGIDINDPINLVAIPKGYHKVLHTNLYYGLLNASICLGYATEGSRGVKKILHFYKGLLEGLNYV